MFVFVQELHLWLAFAWVGATSSKMITISAMISLTGGLELASVLALDLE